MGGGAGHGHDCKCQLTNWKPSSAKLKALAASVANLSDSVNIVATPMGAKGDAGD